MTLVGIDIGNQTCYVGAAIGGGIEIITNDVTDRLTPAIISFRTHDRQIGARARSQTIINYKNTLLEFKNLLGREYADPIVQKEICKLPFTVGQYPSSNEVGIMVNYLGENRWFTPTQIYSMLLRHITETAEKTLNTKIASAVISVPTHFTDMQRRAVLDAAKLAGVNLQRLLNDGNAVALAYGIYKKDLPEDDHQPRNVAFVDIGHTSLQVNIFAFSNGKANCLSSVSNPQLGGRDFDERLFHHFATQFNQKYKLNIFDFKKPCLKLITECEKLKKLLSANITSIPMNIECLLDDFDFSSRITRVEFEELCSDLLIQVENNVQEALSQSKMEAKDLYSVELVGGSSRIPAVSTIVEKVFGKEVSKTLNFDESVAKGCAIQCALLSPTIRVRQFHVVGVVPYAIRINWFDAETGDKGEMNAFKVGSPSNLSKVLSYYRKSDFKIECSYNHPHNTNHHNPSIAVFTIKNVKPTEEGEASKVKVKFRVDNSGILTIPNVELVEKKIVEVKEEEKLNEKSDGKDKGDKGVDLKNQAEMDKVKLEISSDDALSETTEKVQDGDASMSDSTTTEILHPSESTESPDAPPMDVANQGMPILTPNEDIEQTPEAQMPKKFKEVINSILLPVMVEARCMSQIEIDRAMEIEGKLLSQDYYQAEKANCKNKLEEYVYEMRDKVDSYLSEFFQESTLYTFKTGLEKIDNWLVDDDTQEEPSVYKQNLKGLRDQGDPAIMRYREFQDRPEAFNLLGQSLVRYRKFLDEFRGGNEQYSHLQLEDVEKVEVAVKEKQAWLEEQLQAHQNLLTYQNPNVTAAEIIANARRLEDIAQPIMTKPIPKPIIEPPKDEVKPTGKPQTVTADDPPADSMEELPAPGNQEPLSTQDTLEAQQGMDLD